MKSEFVTAITQLAAEKGVPREMVLEAIQSALVSAYKHDQEDTRLITAAIENRRAKRPGGSKVVLAPGGMTSRPHLVQAPAEAGARGLRSLRAVSRG